MAGRTAVLVLALVAAAALGPLAAAAADVTPAGVLAITKAGGTLTVTGTGVVDIVPDLAQVSMLQAGHPNVWLARVQACIGLGCAAAAPQLHSALIAGIRHAALAIALFVAQSSHLQPPRSVEHRPFTSVATVGATATLTA